MGQIQFIRKWIGPVFLIIAVILTPLIAFDRTNEKLASPLNILIIYSSGTPLNYYTNGPLFETIRNRIPREVDAVTTATPLNENCRTIAEKLASALREQKIVVHVTKATDISNRNEILKFDLIIIGTPSRFGNVSWEIKKLFDEQFSQIAALEDKGFAKRSIAAFSMAEIKPSASAALKAIRSAVRDCNGRFGPTMIFLTKNSEKEIKKRISQFVHDLLNFP